MRVALLLLSVMFLLKSKGQTLYFYGGEKLYIDSVSVIKNNIKSLYIREYSIYGKKRALSDQYEVTFDSKGKPFSIIPFNVSQRKAGSAIPLKTMLPKYDSIFYDKNYNVTHIKGNNNYDNYYTYDHLNRMIYSVETSHGSSHKYNFYITYFAYDSKSRLIKKIDKYGYSKVFDTLNVKETVERTFQYDNEKLVSSKTVTKKADPPAHEPAILTDDFIYEYDTNGLLNRIRSLEQKGYVGRREVIISKTAWK